MTDTDVLVVGGGATGVGVARDLALRGLEVVLVERGGLASGTSGRSHGVLHSGARYAEADPEGARECLRENRILRRIAGECVAEVGGLFVSLSEDDPAYFDRKRAACLDAGIDAEELDPAVARESVPGLSDDVRRAMRVPDAVVYPSRLVAATAASARKHGATIHTHSPLEALNVDNGRIVAADVGGVGRVRPQFVVNATGAWADECASLAGVTVPMRPTRGVMIAVEYSDLEVVLNRCRAPDDGDIAVPHGDRAVLGTTSLAVDDPDNYPREQWELDRTITECRAMIPVFADCEPVRTYWGVRPLYEPAEAAPDALDATDDGGNAHNGTEAAANTGPTRGISRGFVLLDHAVEGIDNFASIVGGKLTTHRLMAEATADLVCNRLDVDATCNTAETPLPGASDPTTLDQYVQEFDAESPADTDIIGSEST